MNSCSLLPPAHEPKKPGLDTLSSAPPTRGGPSHFGRAGRASCLALALLLLGRPSFSHAEDYTFVTLAGPPEPGAGSRDGLGNEARFNAPCGVAMNAAGQIWVADRSNHTIRYIAPKGEVTSLAGLAGATGTWDGVGSEARFNLPYGVAVDGAGNAYAADTTNHAIRSISSDRRVSLLAGHVGTAGYADGTGINALFKGPSGVAVDSSGNIYVADTGNHVIRKVTPGGAVTTFAGQAGSAGLVDGTGNAARFYSPAGVAVDGSGNVFVADTANNCIRKITATRAVSTFAGSGLAGALNGTGTAARFNHPFAVAVDASGNVFVADTTNHLLRKITAARVVSTFAGKAGLWGWRDGTGTAATFSSPAGVAADSAGNVCVADTGNHTLRKITPTGVVTTFAGRPTWSAIWDSEASPDGAAPDARFGGPSGTAVDAARNVYVADSTLQTIRKISPAGQVTTLAGSNGLTGTANGVGSAARFNQPAGLAVLQDDPGIIPAFLVADFGNHAIRVVTGEGEVSTVAGLAGVSGTRDGAVRDARFNYPSGVARCDNLTFVVADQGNHTIRLVRIGANSVATLAGRAGISGTDDGPGNQARFRYPTSVASDPAAGCLYVADTGNHTIRKITYSADYQNVVVTTYAGRPGLPGYAHGEPTAGQGWIEAQFHAPYGVAVDGAGHVYVADTGNHSLRKFVSAWEDHTVAGSNVFSGGADGTGASARFRLPVGLAVDKASNLYVTDDNRNVRFGTPAIQHYLACTDVSCMGQEAAIGDSRCLFPCSTTSNDQCPAVYPYYPAFSEPTIACWSWRLIRRPTGSLAQLSSASLEQPTFTPDVADLFTFQLWATNALGRMASREVRLHACDMCAPILLAGPQSQMVMANGSCSFRVEVQGVPTIHFQWGFSGHLLAGQTNQSLQLDNVQPEQAGEYQVYFNNGASQNQSASAVLTVLIGPPQITTPPQNQTVAIGRTAGFGVGAAGYGTLHYQWLHDGKPLAGEIQPWLRLPNVQPCHSGQYAVVVANVGGAVTSAVATLSVFVAPPAVERGPQSRAAGLGQTVSLDAEVTGSPPFYYQWQFNGTNLPGANAAVLWLRNLQASQAGPYAVVVSNTAGCVTSSPAVLTLNQVWLETQPLAAEGVLRLVLHGQAGRKYSVLASSNLLSSSWETLAVITNGTGTTSLSDPVTNRPRRFYRLQEWP